MVFSLSLLFESNVDIPCCNSSVLDDVSISLFNIWVVYLNVSGDVLRHHLVGSHDEDHGPGAAHQDADVHLSGVVDAMEADPGDQFHRLARPDRQVEILVEDAPLLLQNHLTEPLALDQARHFRDATRRRGRNRRCYRG